MKRIAEALGVARSGLASSRPVQPRTSYAMPEDAALLERIQAVVERRPSYGYRRVTAALNREVGAPRVNHKRVYRVMRREKLLLRRYGPRPERPHDGKVVTLASNLRWCTDAFELRCWNGEKVYVAFSLR
ncbi:MAG: IS3 family transposase [Myxococcota bacterium]